MIWKSKIKGDDVIIAFIDTILYKGNPTPDLIEKAIHALNTQKNTAEYFTCIPLSYIKEIHLEEGKNYIEVFFGTDSTEHLRIEDSSKRHEIFQFLISNVPKSTNYVDHYSKFRAGKKPLIAIVVLSILFGWTLFLANEMEQGVQYEVSKGLTGVVLAMATFGVRNVILLFSGFLSFAFWGLYQKIKKPKVIHKIIIKR